MTKNIIIIALITVLLFSVRSCVNKNTHIRSISNYHATQVDSFKNELGLIEYRIMAKDQTIQNMRIADAKRYYRLRDELKKRDIKIKDLNSRVEFSPLFNNEIVLETKFLVDTMYMYLPIDTTVNFNDNYLDADLAVRDSSLSLDYTYRPGNIYVDIYKQRDGWFKSKQTKASIQFENPNVSMDNVDVIINDRKLRAVIAFGAGYGIIPHNNNILMKPSVGVYAGFPILRIYKNK